MPKFYRGSRRACPSERLWRSKLENTAYQKSAFEVPVSKRKVDLLMACNANGVAMAGGANFVNSIMFAVNEQKYFASTDGSYIDQDVHRLISEFYGNQN